MTTLNVQSKALLGPIKDATFNLTRPSGRGLADSAARTLGLGAFKSSEGSAGTLVLEYAKGTVTTSGNTIGRPWVAKVDMTGLGDVPVSVVEAAIDNGFQFLLETDGALGTHSFGFANGTIVTRYNDAGELEVTRILPR